MAIVADDVGFHGHPITNLVTRNRLAHTGNHASKLVPRYDWIIAHVLAMEDVDIGTTYPNGSDSDLDLVLSRFRYGYVLYDK
jgi:hypothetical protein